MRSLLSKLDLIEYIAAFEDFLARPKPLPMEGDSNLHFRFIQALEKCEFKAPPQIANLDTPLMYLQKSGTLKLYELYEFVKIVGYFLYLKKLPFEAPLDEWLAKIVIPQEILEITRYFDAKGNLSEKIDERFESINAAMKQNKEQIKEVLRRLLGSSKIAPYLVDRQIHYIDTNETLLVRGGFNHVLKGSVAARSSGGYFYVIPDLIDKLRKREAELLSRQDELIYEYEKKISAVFTKFYPFLNFINRAFDRFDAYQARLFFAKSRALEFMKPARDQRIRLSSFAHPALHDPKPITIDFDKKVLMITGVNAGGKTMLLKSILSAVLMAKYLLPMRIDAAKSHIGHFREITAIIDDPQNVKNDISTFAGRMVEFSKLFGKKSFIVGIDEIELGTDSDEAASLFKVILEKLMQKEVKIIITTHHKRLAAMMATHEEVELAAAIYDEAHQRPTFEFLYGTIGKSYAFETALRYGISAAIVEEAKKVYGEDKEKLNDLIQKNIDLELQLKARLKKIESEERQVEKLKAQLLRQREEANEKIREITRKLEHDYHEAITAAREAARSKDAAAIHRQLNIAHKKRQKAKKSEPLQEKIPLKPGDFVKYRKSRGKILSIRKEEALIESEGIKLRVPLSELKRSGNPTPKKRPQVKVHIEKPSTGTVKLDLHGLRAEEAIEKTDKFLSDALIAGYDEVLIYHGIGSGKLAWAVKEFLKHHPKVKSFHDAPPNMGGMGATIVRL